MMVLLVGSIGCTSVPVVENQPSLSLNDFLQQGERGRSAIVDGHEIVLLHNAQNSDGRWCRQYSDNGTIHAACLTNENWTEMKVSK
jgi:hypothetical protein